MRLILNQTNMSRLQHFFKTDAVLHFLTGIAILSLLLPCFAGADPNIKPQEIPDFLTQKGKSLSALKAVLNITSIYDAGKSRQDVKGFLLYRRPNDFRFQGLSTGGNSLFELIIKSNNFDLYVPTEGKIITGGKDCFSRKFPDVAEIEGLIPLILLQWKDVRFDRVLIKDAEKTVIRVSFQGKVWGATFDPQTLYLKRLVRLSPKGDVELTADFGDFKTGEDAWLPRRFDLLSPAGAWRTSVHISKLERNPFLIEKNFKLEMPFSAKTETCQ